MKGITEMLTIRKTLFNTPLADLAKEVSPKYPPNIPKYTEKIDENCC